MKLTGVKKLTNSKFLNNMYKLDLINKSGNKKEVFCGK